jgi:hypothetical protein
MGEARRIRGLVAGLLLVLAAACRSTTDEPRADVPVGTSTKPDVKPDARAGVCAPSSVARGAACPERKVPPGTGSSPEGCKSDADCKSGIEGRCVGQRVTVDLAPRSAERARDLLAAPPPPPLRSQCVYDQCRADKDCGAGARCDCRPGVGSDRNQCKPLDACLGDRDCSADTLCTCGSAGVANACSPGNCRTDADCNGLACEPDSNGYRFCRSPRDACSRPTDCKVDAASYGTPICVFKPAAHARVCDVSFPPPPG